MLKSISLKFTELAQPITIPGQGITIFVGPNNAGKSLFLRELESAISASAPVKTKILADYELVWPTDKEIAADIERLRKTTPPEIPINQVRIKRFASGGYVEVQDLDVNSLVTIVNQKDNKHWFSSQFFKFFTLRLDGRTRFTLTDDKPTGDLLLPPSNTLAHLFVDNALRKRIRTIIIDAFGTYFAIDPLLGAQLRIRLSDSPPTPRRTIIKPKSPSISFGGNVHKRRQ